MMAADVAVALASQERSGHIAGGALSHWRSL